VHYVRSGATGAGDGSSWADAFAELVPALAAAHAGDQVWVAQGVYTPAAGGLDPDAMFLLPSGAEIYGGFTGVELTLGQRDPSTHVTTLSGDLLGDDALGEEHWIDNTHHLTLAEGTTLETVLDGFVLRAAHGEAVSNFLAGGLRVHGGSLTIRRCTFEDFSGYDGALQCGQPGTTVIEGCVFRNNVGNVGSGAIEIKHDHFVDVSQSLFLGNSGHVVAGRSPRSALERRCSGASSRATGP
jgi:hypothetical protein